MYNNSIRLTNKITFILTSILSLNAEITEKYIKEENLKESSIENNKIYIYPLKIDKNSYIKTSDDKKKHIMIDSNYLYCVFKYNKKNYIVVTSICLCCYNNCYSILIKDKYSNSIIGPEHQEIVKDLKEKNVTPVLFYGENFLVCNEYLKYRSRNCCNCCKPKFFSGVNVGKKKLMEMIFVTDTDFENKAVTLDLCENVKILDINEELNIIYRKTNNEILNILKLKL